MDLLISCYRIVLDITVGESPFSHLSFNKKDFSACHLNPVFTLATLLVKQIKPLEVVAYLSVQLLGSFCGSIAVRVS